MTANSSNDSGDHTSHPSFTNCLSLDALGLFQSPRLLELERTLGRHPDYAILKLKEQMARLPECMGRGVVSLKSVDSFRDVGGGMGSTNRAGYEERSLGPPGTVAPATRSNSKNRRGLTPCERLRNLWSEKEGKFFLTTANTVETIAKCIGRGLTATKGSEFFKAVIAPERKVHTTLRKYEARTARERADRARAEARQRGGRRKQNRPQF